MGCGNFAVSDTTGAVAAAAASGSPRHRCSSLGLRRGRVPWDGAGWSWASRGTQTLPAPWVGRTGPRARILPARLVLGSCSKVLAEMTERSLCSGTGPSLTVPPQLLLAEGPGGFLQGMGRGGWCFPTRSGGPEHLLRGGQRVLLAAPVSGAWAGGSDAAGVRLPSALSAIAALSRSWFHASAVSPLYLGGTVHQPPFPLASFPGLNPFPPSFSPSPKPGSGFSVGVLEGLF